MYDECVGNFHFKSIKSIANKLTNAMISFTLGDMDIEPAVTPKIGVIVNVKLYIES